MRLKIALFAFIILLLALGQILPSESTEKSEQEHYCEMVEIHQDSNGQYGWPPFKGECK